MNNTKIEQFQSFDTICMLNAMHEVNGHLLIKVENDWLRVGEFYDMCNDDYHNDETGKYSFDFSYNTHESVKYNSETKTSHCKLSTAHLFALIHIYDYYFESNKQVCDLLDTATYSDYTNDSYVEFDVYGNSIVTKMMCAFDLLNSDEIFYRVKR